MFFGVCFELRVFNEFIFDWKDKGVREIFELLYSDNIDMLYRKCDLMLIGYCVCID